MEWNFHHVTSSPHYPQGNGATERVVRTAKETIKQEDVFKALLVYRSTPIPELEASPAELAMGRRLRTTLPSLPGTLSPRTVNKAKVRERDSKFKGRQKTNFDRHHGANPLPLLRPGDPVAVKLDGEKGWKQSATVVESCAARSYILRTPEGADLRRNRRHTCKSTGGGTPFVSRHLATPVVTPSPATQQPANLPSSPQSADQQPTVEQSEGDHPLQSSPSIQPSSQGPTPMSKHTRSGRRIVCPAISGMSTAD